MYFFLWLFESDYDIFVVGYLFILISVGLGMVVVVEKEGKNRKVVVVIGDGVMIVGMVFEVFNYVGDIKKDMVVVFNDNEMFIFENVGVLNSYLVCLFIGNFFNFICDGGKKLLSNVFFIKEFVSCVEEYIKGMVVLGMIFEEFGFNYIGFIDGYDVNGVVDMLCNMCKFDGL